MNEQVPDRSRLENFDLHEVSNEATLVEAMKLGLPNLAETVKIEHEIARGERVCLRPLHVRPPLPGKYTTSPGDRLSRRGLMGAVDEWLTQTDGQARFIIQGGNRYVSSYATEVFDCPIPDIKVMSVDKAPLSTQLLTILTAEERQALIDREQLRELIPLLPPEVAITASSMSRAELLHMVANFNIQTPFSSVTYDECLEGEFSAAIAHIEEGIVIPSQAAISILMRGSTLSNALRRHEPVHFLDDLFYRGRTLYSLAVLITACGGDPMNMRLTTLGSDIKSYGLKSPFHKILREDILYPFENSIRTEQGYWQDVGTHYIFTDMGAYWEYLRTIVDPEQSENKYSEWQAAMKGWLAQYLPELSTNFDMSLVGPLLWLSVYHSNFGLELDINRIVDQKGYKIGASVPFAQLIDRFISQEEPVKVRQQFKNQIRDILSAVEVVASANPDGYRSLVNLYKSNQHALDYAGLAFMTEQDGQHVTLNETENKAGLLVAEVARDVATQALEVERPLLVGVNGVDGSGKTMLSAKLRKQLEMHELPVVVVHIDDFTQPYSQRITSADPIERYYNNTFDIATLRKAILTPIVAGQLGSVLLRHESPHNRSKVVEHEYSFTHNPSVVIVEGVFIFRPELADYFDTKIFVDISLPEMRERAIERDVPSFGFGVLKKYLTRYIPAQMRYLEAVRPFDIADIVIDNTDWHNPYIVEKGVVNVQQTTT